MVENCLYSTGKYCGLTGSDETSYQLTVVRAVFLFSLLQVGVKAEMTKGSWED